MYRFSPLLAAALVACSATDVPDHGNDSSTLHASAYIAGDDVATHRNRAQSDDAQTVEEAFAHAEARAAVIRHVKPNGFGVGGAEFRVKRNPVGSGAFVYDPRPRHNGAVRTMVWWVHEPDIVYPLNSPAKTVTPDRPFPHEAGVSAPPTLRVVAYVFEGKPFPDPKRPLSGPELAPLTCATREDAEKLRQGLSFTVLLFEHDCWATDPTEDQVLGEEGGLVRVQDGSDQSVRWTVYKHDAVIRE